jgi:glyoxylase-like metal-dependent hydrolase (beta-lactamase superfamily II)
MNYRKLISAGVLAGVASLSGVAFADGGRCAAGGPWLPDPMEAHQLKPNVYWMEGGGGNSTVIIGDKGVVVVDSKVNKASGEELLANIAKLTNKPVTTVILTHSDGDHANGLAAFPPGIKVITSEGAKKELEEALAKNPKSPFADHMPTQTMGKQEETLKLEGETIQLYHWAPAHTNGDLVIYLPKEKIVATGDLFSTQCPDGIYHQEKGATTEGWLISGKGVAALDANTFILGHGWVHDRAWIQARVTRLEEKRAKIKAMVAEGKSLDEIRTALGETPLPPPMPNRVLFPNFTEVTYAELTAKK